jgi:acyl-CoA reductase-like NAD-dependent aldehyde dehydrogenase
MFYKKARLEFHPVGVVGAIVPFNYPFHNIFNPLTAALFAGNAIVIKVSEHASWSGLRYKRIIDAALKAAGAPADLVQIVTGYADAGHALVTSGLGKLIFVGSTSVGHQVMAAAATKLTPVVLELGGKDAFVVCEDANLKTVRKKERKKERDLKAQKAHVHFDLLPAAFYFFLSPHTNNAALFTALLLLHYYGDFLQVVPTALRGAFQASGQNCMGAERFIIHTAIHDRFVSMVEESVKRMRMGPGSSEGPVDFGAMCLPGLAEKVHWLVQDAVAQGAKASTVYLLRDFVAHST